MMDRGGHHMMDGVHYMMDRVHHMMNRLYYVLCKARPPSYLNLVDTSPNSACDELKKTKDNHLGYMLVHICRGLTFCHAKHLHYHVLSVTTNCLLEVSWVFAGFVYTRLYIHTAFFSLA